LIGFEFKRHRRAETLGILENCRQSFPKTSKHAYLIVSSHCSSGSSSPLHSTLRMMRGRRQKVSRRRSAPLRSGLHRREQGHGRFRASRSRRISKWSCSTQVPGDTQGRDQSLRGRQGRIYTSDQYGGLYRFTPPAPGHVLEAKDVQKVPVDIRAVNGMVFAFGALYVGVNDYDGIIPLRPLSHHSEQGRRRTRQGGAVARDGCERRFTASTPSCRRRMARRFISSAAMALSAPTPCHFAGARSMG